MVSSVTWAWIGRRHAGLFKRLVAAGDGGFDFEDVLRGLNQQQVHPAADEANRLFTKYFGEVIEGDIGEFGVVGGGEFAAGSDGTGHKTGSG